ncbi:unnamed protein product [Merluccius merluccius]
MNREKEHGDYDSGEDLDEDEATQYIIEQSLIQYRKLKGLSPSRCYCITLLKCHPHTVSLGDEEALNRLMIQPRALSKVDERGWIPLHEAAVQGRRKILEDIFSGSSQGAGQCRTLKGETPLFLAVVYGLRGNATFLVQNGCNPDLQNDEQDSPLVAAMLNDQYDLATLLLRYNANVDQTGSLDRTALHEAAFLGLENFVHLFLESGANPNAYDIKRKTPLALAAQNGHLNVVEILLQKGSNVEKSEFGTVLFEAAASGNPDIVSTLLDHGADANIPLYSGHLPIHRVAYHGHILALEHLIPVTKVEAVKESGMSPLHSAAAGGHAQCIEVLLRAGHDPNMMLHQRVRRNYDDERRSALFFAVANNDLQCARLLLEAGAMVNQDPISCLQVALRQGNYELINALLKSGANVNYYSRVNTTHFPSAVQYALKDEVMLRMILNHGYDVKRCFDCPYSGGSHDYAPWTSSSVIKDMMFCEVITVHWLRQLSGQVVRMMLDYTDHVSFCTKLKDTLQEQKQWEEICHIQRNTRSLKHLCRLRIRRHMDQLRLRSPVFIGYLPLPPRLRDYLRYKEYDVYSRGSIAGP